MSEEKIKFNDLSSALKVLVIFGWVFVGIFFFAIILSMIEAVIFGWV